MKKLLVLILILFSKFDVSAVPNYAEVISFYFKNYEEDYESYVEFSKRKEGWHAERKDYQNPSKVLNKVMLWSKQSDNWIMNKNVLTEPISIEDAKDRTTKFKRNSSYYNDSIFFAIHDYYGYAGWDWDVIEYLDNKPNKNTTNLESLARAYSNYAMGFFYNQYGHLFENNNPHRRLLAYEEGVESTRADSFSIYAQKAVDNFEKIVEIDSNYQTLLGKITNKLNNEKAYAYYTLDIMGFEEKGIPFLKDIQFNDSLLNTAQQRLKQKNANTIIFTLGDLDHFPLIFLQQNHNLKNVVILNYSLLQSPRYLKYVRRKYPQLRMSFSDTFYAKQEYFSFSKLAVTKANKTLSWKDFVINFELLHLKDGLPIMYHPSNDVKLKINNHTISLGRFTVKNDLVLLDLIENNQNSTIYFTGKFGEVEDFVVYNEALTLFELSK